MSEPLQELSGRDSISKVDIIRQLPREGESLSPRAHKPDYKIDENGCWVWQKYRTAKGYGLGAFNGKTGVWAHVAYWTAANGPLPTGRHIVVDHLCRNPSCVNPKHLEAVEQATNVHRGRAAKLNMEIAREVRRRVQEGQSSAQIKRELDVSIQNVWWIAEDRAWREDPTAPRQPVWPIRDCAVCERRIGSERGRRAVYCSNGCRNLHNNRKQQGYYERRGL